MKHILVFTLMLSAIFSQVKRSSIFGGMNINSISGSSSTTGGIAVKNTAGAPGMYFGYRYSNYEASGYAIIISFDQKTFSGSGNALFYDPQLVEILIPSELTTRVTYFNFSPQYQIIDERGIIYYFGPNIGFNATASLQITSPGRDRTFDVSPMVKFLRLSLIAGIGYKINDYMISLSYDRGFTEYLDISDRLSNSKFNSLQFSIAYLWYLDI